MVAVVDINLNLVLPERAIHLGPCIQRTELNVERFDFLRLQDYSLMSEKPLLLRVHQF